MPLPLSDAPTPPRPGPRAEVRVELVTSLERLEALGPAWADLWARSPGATPFSSPAWLLPWCRHLLQGGSPWALTAWRGGHLMALAPTFHYLAGGRRLVGLLGGGASDYQDVLAEDGGGAEALLEALADRRGEYDACDLQALPPGSPLLAERVPRTLAATIRDQDACPAVPLPPRLADLGERVSRKLLSDLRYRRRRLARRGPVTFVRAGAAEVDDGLGALFRLHASRWGTRGEPGVLAEPRLQRFHREAAPALHRRGLLRLYALRVGGATAGVLYALAARGRIHAYVHGIDPAYAADSPGGLLFLHAVEDGIAEGARELDLLRGREPYKYRWGAEDRWTRRLVLQPRSEAGDG